MAKVSSKPATRLQIGLHDPGLTPMLRAGLGGLAAAVKAVGPDAFEDCGTISIEASKVTLEWPEPGAASALLEKLFVACFQIQEGLLSLPGTFHLEPPLEVRVAQSDALRLTFLQHGSSAKKDGGGRPRSFEIDDTPRQILVQAYREFVHQGAWKDIGKLLDKPSSKTKTVSFAGWANPGAAERHVGLGNTDIEYLPGEALCACFTIVGCISLLGPNRTGILLVPDPTDLKLFARLRPRLSPKTLKECVVASAGDGVLAVHAALHTAELQSSAPGVGELSATVLRATSWASQQKTRTDTLVASRYEDAVLEAFRQLMLLCPARLVATKGKKAGEPGGYWGIPSALRGFVADNIAEHRPFYAGFAVAKTGDDPPRWLHRFRTKGDDLGALRFPDDRKGLIEMTATLREAQRLLVASIHTALRKRFGAIADENKGNKAAFGKRCEGERDKWRLAFAGSRTHEQCRRHLADLWSRAGSIAELKGTAWHTLQPLLEAPHWEEARDLALVALASYQGKESEDVANEEGE